MKKLETALGAAAALLVLGSLASPAGAQPFGAWVVLAGPTSGYTEVPHDPALNPASATTIEGWASVGDANGGHCSAIVGKGCGSAWCVGICGTTLNSVLTHGAIATTRSAGTLSGWTHFAVVYDGAHRYHYINGELIGSWTETGGLAGSSFALRIGSDAQWVHSPSGSIAELRLWNVARTQAQIRQGVNVPLTAAEPGLVAVWSDGLHDALHHFDGTFGGSGIHLWTFPATISCGASGSGSLCLLDHFSASMTYRVGASGTPEVAATTVPYYNPGSGLFYFNNPNDWQILVKMLDGCAINGHYWVGTAASTNLFYRLNVINVQGGPNKVYFNYPGPIAPSVLDTSAFNCPG